MHFLASCSCIKVKPKQRTTKVKHFFFKKQVGYVMRIRRETLQIADWISFSSVHPLQLMHLFLYVSSARENWIMEVFWNVLLLPSESNIYTCFHSPRTCLLFLYHRSLFSHSHTHIHILMWSAQTSAQSSRHWCARIAHLCSRFILLSQTGTE